MFKGTLLLYLLGLSRMIFCFIYEFINMFILFSRPTVYMAMLSYLCVTLLLTLNEIYYKKIIEEDPENILKKVFNKDNLPEIKDVDKEIGVSKPGDKTKKPLMY